MEQTLGHVTISQNWRAAIEGDDAADVNWIPVTFPREQWWETLPVLRMNWSLRGSIKAWRALKVEHKSSSNSSDLYLFHTQVVSLLSSGWADKAPTVVSLDATPLNYDRVGSAYDHVRGNVVMERLKFWLNARSFHAATLLVPWSDWARRSLIEDYGVSSDKIEVIPPGTNIAFWESNDSSARTNHKLRLLFVGGQFERKGGKLLLEVFHEKFAETCELHLVTKAEVAEGEGVFVHRNVPPNSEQLRELFRNADIFVLPTQGDVHSLASIEAMAAGLPVVTTSVGAIPEIVVPGETGFLIPPGDGNALANALFQLTGDKELRHRMGANGRARAALMFDAHANARRLLAACKRIAAERSAGTRRL